jgi:putative hydrolase of HD superfamily
VHAPAAAHDRDIAGHRSVDQRAALIDESALSVDVEEAAQQDGPWRQHDGRNAIHNAIMRTERLRQQLGFITEIDQLKSILRRTPLADGSRLENSAEHSWHIIVCAMVLREYVAGPVDLCRVFRMLAIHDIVEIDAGDTFAYDVDAHASKEEREKAAAARLFGLLPTDQREEFTALWNEFEARTTIEARLANAVDRLQPLLLNAAAKGGSWHHRDVTTARVRARLAPVADAMPALGEFVEGVIQEFTAAGIIGSD